MNDEVTNTDVATSSFRWDVIPPKVRMRRDVVFSFEDLLGECEFNLIKKNLTYFFLMFQSHLVVLWRCFSALV